MEYWWRGGAGEREVEDKWAWDREADCETEAEGRRAAGARPGVSGGAVVTPARLSRLVDGEIEAVYPASTARGAAEAGRSVERAWPKKVIAMEDVACGCRGTAVEEVWVKTG